MLENKMPQVRVFMTPVPQTVAAGALVGQVESLMRELKVRHLPVKLGDSVVGIVTHRIVREALADRYGGVLTAQEVMIKDPFEVHPETPLDEVAAEMAEEKYSCAFITDDDKKLVGIFTTVDACRALRQVLEATYAG